MSETVDVFPILSFIEDKPRKKTKTWNVVSGKNQRLLGRICWCADGYEFQPEGSTILLSEENLYLISDFLCNHTITHKKGKDFYE